MKDNSTISQEFLERIERYYNDTMPQEERTEFENKLTSDEAFKTQVEDIKTLLLGIETQALKEQLDTFHKDIPEKTLKDKSSKIKLFQFAKYAVAAILVLAIGSYWYFGQPTNEKLYTKYFTPDPGLPTTMSATNNFEFYDAMVNYKHGEYKIAISKWKKIEQKNPTNDTINYFLGVAFMAEKNETESIPYFQKVLVENNSVFTNDAYYYIGLAYLKNNNLDKAKENFKNSTSEKSFAILAELK